MPLTVTSLAKVLEKTSGSSYFPFFVQLVGKTDQVLLYEGIQLEDKKYAEEIEEKLERYIPFNYLEFLTIVNGGRIIDMNFYSLCEQDNVDSLYYRNFVADTRKKHKVPDNVLIIGEYEKGIICLELGDDDTGQFTLMDIYNRERVEFAFLEDLLTFRFYLRLLEGGKKKIEEKEKLKAAAKKLHDQIVQENKARKKFSDSKRRSLAKSASKAALKRVQAKAKASMPKAKKR